MDIVIEFYKLYDVRCCCKTNLRIFTQHFIQNFPSNSTIDKILNYKKRYKDSRYDINNYISHLLWISLINAYHIIFNDEKNIHGHESLMKIRAECFDLLPNVYDNSFSGYSKEYFLT